MLTALVDIVILLRTDYRRPAGILDDVRKSSAKTRAPLAVSGATQVHAFPSSNEEKKFYSELITGDPPAFWMMSARSSGNTREPLAVSGAT